MILLNPFAPKFLFRFVPGPILYFSQIAELFTNAKGSDLEFRAEGWDCAGGGFREIDVRPFFPILADSKENRFQRAVYFYRGNHQVLKALDDYIINRYNRYNAKTGGGDGGDTVEGRASGEGSPSVEGPSRIGGIRLVTVRDSIPASSKEVRRYRRKDLAEYPESDKTILYYTPIKRRSPRCGDGAASSEKSGDKPDEQKRPEAAEGRKGGSE